MQLNRERFSSGEVVCGSLLTHNLGSSLFRHTIQGRSSHLVAPLERSAIAIVLLRRERCSSGE
jgi:hypothetical protein